MTIAIKQFKHPNILGIIASGLCLIHCLMTPLFFAFQASVFKFGNEFSEWWQLIDWAFLIISLLAIIAASENTSRIWMKYALYMSWIVLTVIILNEKVHLLEIPEAAIYIPTIALIFFHFYNRKYCNCSNGSCCVSETS